MYAFRPTRLSSLVCASPLLWLAACADETAESGDPSDTSALGAIPVGEEGMDSEGWTAEAKVDADGDGYAAGTGALKDCDDTDASVHPGATELDNGIDDDCDKWVDEDFVSVGDIIVTEINKRSLMGGSGVVNGASWVEIHNTSSRTVDLAYWVFARGTSSYANKINFDPDAAPVLAPGEYAVICDSGAYQGSSVAYPLTCDYVWGDDSQPSTYKSTYHDNTFYLRRDSDAVSLYINGTRTTGTLIDTVNYVSGWPNKARFSLSLDPGSLDGTSNDSSSSWCSTTASSTGAVSNNNTYRWYDVSGTSADEYGTPGAANYVCAVDADGDGYDTTTDCDDTDASVHPGATETCNGIDDDCDGSIDEGVGTTYYADSDGDTYGDSATSTTACSQPSGYVTDNTDCDDTDAAVNPGATEICGNGIDDDCDGNIDNGSASTWYADADSDGYGDSAASTSSCSQPSGYVADSSDCDDTDAAVNPGATEVCNNGVDDDCDPATNCEASGSQEIKATGEVWHYNFRGYGTAANMSMGSSVCNNGDFNGDGYDDVVVGESYYDVGTSTDNGRIWMWYGGTDLSGDSLSTVDHTIDGSTSQISDYFGSACTFADDVDGDAQNDLLAAANMAGSSNTGAAYLFYGGSSASSVSSADATFTSSGTNDYLGTSLAEGDIDSDGLTDIAVGAYGRTSSTGSVGLWNATGIGGTETLTGTANALLNGASTSDTFGYSIALGDLNGDGDDDLIVGQPAASSTTATSRVYVYTSASSLSGTVSTSSASATYTSSSGGDRLGLSVGILGDSDGDGTIEFLASADKNDGSATDAGAVYVISGVPSSGSAASVADTIIQGEVASDFFGRTVAGVGDLNNDTYDDAMFGATGYDVGSLSGAGAVYLFYGPMALGTIAASTYDARFTGANSSDAVGLSLAGGGDVNADGYADWMSGATSWDGFGYLNSGGSWMFFGTGE